MWHAGGIDGRKRAKIVLSAKPAYEVQQRHTEDELEGGDSGLLFSHRNFLCEEKEGE